MEWDQDPEQRSRELDKARAENLGLSGVDFVSRENETAVCRTVAELLSERLHQKFVSPPSISALHPEISLDTASSTATTMSIELLQRSINKRFECPIKDLRADMLQIVRGTNMGTHEGLSMLCLALAEDPEDILARATYMGSICSVEVSQCSSVDDVEVSQTQFTSARADCSSSPLLLHLETAETIRALGKILTSELAHALVASRAVQSLHPEISDGMASGCAYELSLTLVMARLRALPDFPTANHSSLTQVLGGTLSSRKGAFDALCAALGVSGEAVLARARAQGLER